MEARREAEREAEERAAAEARSKEMFEAAEADARAARRAGKRGLFGRGKQPVVAIAHEDIEILSSTADPAEERAVGVVSYREELRHEDIFAVRAAIAADQAAKEAEASGGQATQLKPSTSVHEVHADL